MKQRVLTVALVMSCVSSVWAAPTQNGAFNVPQSGAIVVDGDLSDWTASTAWSAPFIYWNGSGPSTVSTTQAKFTWNAASDLLYIAYRTNEITKQVGGHAVVGISQTINGNPSSAVGATQLAFDVVGSNVTILNEIAYYGILPGSGTNGVQADSSLASDGVTTTYEIAVPLWDNWAAMTTQKALAVGDVLYFYGIMEDKIVGGNGTNMTYLGNPAFYAGLGGNGAALTLVNPLIPGDFDGDGDVDGADFVAWQTHFPTASGATLATGDADGDGDVDGADFVVWQTHFPTTPGGSGVSSIPEPSSLFLTMMMTVGFLLLREVS